MKSMVASGVNPRILLGFFNDLKYNGIEHNPAAEHEGISAY